MKKILLTITSLVVALFAMAQAPNMLNYQGVARNAAGNVLPNQTIGLRLSILNLTATGTPVYVETRTVVTNAFGLFNVQVGGPGFLSQTGTIAGVNWTAFGAGSGAKFLQTEMDPTGGSSYVLMGSTQMLSVPYALYATGAAPVGPAGGDLTGTYPNPTILIPFLRTQSVPAQTMIGMTNSSTTGTLGALQGTSASTDANAVAIQGTISSTSPGGFSAGLRGVNNGTAGLGIGVYGSQNGSGWGVYGTAPNGFGVYGASTTGTGVNGTSTSGVGVNGSSTSASSGNFTNITAANTAVTLNSATNGLGDAISGVNTGTGRGGFFQVNNAASTANALEVTSNGTGASWGIRANNTGTNGAGLFVQSNAANTANNLQSNQAGLGRAGLFNSTNAASTANAVDINVAGTGFALRAASTNGAPKALQTAGGVQLTGIGEALNKILASDATGNATWQTPALIGVVTGSGTLNYVPKWTPNGTNLGNSLLFDDGTNMAIGTTSPTHRFTVTHGGSTGIGVNSTAGFSVVDINAQNGDAALRFQKNGVGQWNIRNRPGDDYLEIFELGGGGSRMVIQDGSGNVGIGSTVNPSYRLDVQHGGSTGIRSQSTAGFSLVDIDANNGDAALRYMANGVGQWNVRNMPGSNNLEWFELGIGSRMTLQDATGNLGVGTGTPAYRLDVQHGGATGIRSQSTASFSVVDIDAQNGDAALRFQKAGAGMWNTRNRPADDYYEIFELGGGGSRMVIQDATGNVGIGETTNPTYKLDVLHGGSTGIRSRSSGSFSVVDIDAASGDAALRFAKAGVNQWNIRNRPADDYLEIFELGGGGSRMVIQDATGNVGIGETTNPTYKLDVLHGGSTGIRSRSSSSFSVVDIDAASGDAALRFQKAGVNQWNTRNRPADDYYEIFELGGGGSRFVIQDGTGNVGIGQTVSPSYKLDVLHGGATGLRVQSSSTFSIIDIDAANGDAALRFAKAGVNQWNTRNRPADDYYEIFELGGGGSRFVIQDGTGNVGIGETTNPTYKLDVLHGGATGIRSRSSGTFSLMDIDAANGDAALRFAKAGVNQWNMRNNPATDDLQFFELGGGGERMRIDNTTGKVWVNGDFTALGAKLFTMDHPLDPENKLLMHASVESNEVLNMYSGNVTTDASGKATVTLPAYFEAINKDFRYQLTVIGGTFAQAMISKEVSNNKFEIATNQPNVKVSWEIKGVRNDKRMLRTPFVAEQLKTPAQKGKYVDPASYNLPENRGVSYDANLVSSLSDVKLSTAKPGKIETIIGTSLEDVKVTPKVTPKVTDNPGSLADVPVVKPTDKKVDISGSVLDVPVVKPTDKKLDINGSIIDVPATKAVVKPIDKDGSVAPVKKDEVKPVAKSNDGGSTKQ